MSHLTIHISDTPTGPVVITTTQRPAVGRRLTAAESLALEMLMRCSPAVKPTYGIKPDAATSLVRDLLDPEQYGYSVTPEVHNAARRVLGIPPVTGATT